MKKEDIPQDYGHLSKLTREVCYAVNEQGEYSTELSTGWEVKASALDAHWQHIEQRIVDARKAVVEGRSSPLHYYMELHLMDVPVLAQYAGFWTWTVRRHLKPATFGRLAERRLRRYAEVFNISVDKLKSPFDDEA